METRNRSAKTSRTAANTPLEQLEALDAPVGRRIRPAVERRHRARVAVVGLFVTAVLAVPTQLSRVIGVDAYGGSGSGSGYCASVGGSVAGANFQNIFACNGHDSVNPPLYNFQCVELAERFFHAAMGFWVWGANTGAQFVYAGSHEPANNNSGPNVHNLPVGAPGVGSLPSPGDIISYKALSGAPYGHVAVVTAVNVSNGSGSITVMEENWGGNGTDAGDNGGYHTITVNGWNWSEWIWGSNSDFSWLKLGLSTPPPPPCTNSGISGSVLGVGQYLCPGQQITSPSGAAGPANAYRLVLQSDGNLVEYSQFRALWASNTAGQTVQDAVMQGDGNLVLYTPSGTPIWASGTSGHPGSYLALQGDANAVIYTSGGSPVWSDGIVASYTQQLIVNTHNAYSVHVCGTNQYGSQVCNTWNTPNYTTDLSNWWWLGNVQIYAYGGYNAQGTYLGEYSEGPLGEAPGYWFSVTFP